MIAVLPLPECRVCHIEIFQIKILLRKSFRVLQRLNDAAQKHIKGNFYRFFQILYLPVCRPKAPSSARIYFPSGPVIRCVSSDRLSTDFFQPGFLSQLYYTTLMPHPATCRFRENAAVCDMRFPPLRCRCCCHPQLLTAASDTGDFRNTRSIPARNQNAAAPDIRTGIPLVAERSTSAPSR